MSGGASCPGPMTRTALLALRTAGALDTSCTYAVTDYSVGTVGAGTVIQLHAVSSTQLSENVSVQTVFDNEAWTGVYNIDLNRVLEMRDNLGNTVSGVSGTEVAVFDWGNPNVTRCTVRGATWTQTIGSARPMAGVEVTDSGILVTTGMTGGGPRDVTVTQATSLNMSNANVTVDNSTCKAASTASAAGFTAGSVWSNVTVDANASLSTAAPTVPVTLTSVKVENGATLSLPNLTVGATSLSDTTIEAGSLIRGAASGAFTGSSLGIERGSQINHAGAGTMTVTQSTVANGGNITDSGTTVAVNVNQTTILSGAVINASAGTLTVIRSTVAGLAQIQKTAGTGTMAVSQTTVTGAGSNITQSVTGTNAFTVADTACTSGGFILQTGAGVCSVSGSGFHGSGRLNHQGARALSMSRVTCHELGIITHNSATAGPADQIDDTEVGTRGEITMTPTGPNGCTLQWSYVSGISGTINVTGTTGTVAAFSASRIRAVDGTVTFSSTAVAAAIIASSTGSNITFSTPVAVTAQRITASEGSQIVVSTGTAMTFMNGTVTSGSTLTVSGATGTVTNVHVSAAGRFTINGGSVNGCTKTMGSTLTTGAFAHTNIGHHTATNKTLTAANTARVDYMGLAAQLV